jgi:hypothetical protein
VLLRVTVELESKFVPLIVKVCAAAPDATKLGTIPLIVGTGWFGGGVPGFPPHPAKSAKPARIVVKHATRPSDFMEVLRPPQSPFLPRENAFSTDERTRFRRGFDEHLSVYRVQASENRATMLQIVSWGHS